MTLAQCVVSDTWKTEIQKVIPKELVIDAFLRVTRTIANEAKFRDCSQQSFLGALLKCARAGLAPDGIHAHLIPFGKEVTAIFDWKGVVDLASRNGIEVIPKVVCEYDKFEVSEDDGNGKTVVHHTWGQGNRGTITGYYSRARKVKDGTVDYEFMSRDEVEETRKNYSNARNSKAWEKSFDEMAKKTVIKRHSKRWPISQEVRAALVDDDDDLTPVPTLTVSRPVFEAQPPKQLKPQPEPEPENTPKFEDSPEPTPEPEKPKKQEEPPPADDDAKPLRQLRHALKAGGIKEGELIDFWGATGAIDGSQATLEEVFITQKEVVLSTVLTFPQVAEKIKERKAVK